MLNNLFWLVPIGSILALGFAYYFFKQMMKEYEGTDTMKKIAQYVREGAMAYLKQQYKVVTHCFRYFNCRFCYSCLCVENPESLGALCLFNRRFFQRSFRFHWNENSHVCFGPYCQCCSEITESWSQGCFPFRCCYGTCCCRSWIA